MLVSRLSRMNNGLYFIYWKSGGGSIAAVGRTSSGGVWVAPVNWLKPLLPDSENYAQHIRGIERMELITTQDEARRRRRVLD